MGWNDKELTERFRGLIGAPVQLACSERPCEEADLSAAERAQLSEIHSAERRLLWLNGRRALKILLARLKQDTDTARIAFPNDRLSLTHSGGVAIGAASGPSEGGVGIDYEAEPRIHDATGPRFLKEREMDYVRSLPEARKKAELLRLWTVKEALFKACLQNFCTGYADYALEDPAALQGQAALPSGERFGYASIPIGAGFISLAVGRTRIS